MTGYSGPPLNAADREAMQRRQEEIEARVARHEALEQAKLAREAKMPMRQTTHAHRWWHRWLPRWLLRR